MSDLDIEARTGTCANCGTVRIKWKPHKHHPLGGRWGCSVIENRYETARRSGPRRTDKMRRQSQESKRPHRKHVGRECERCGFVAEAPAQLDVHHKDGDHSNNAADNLATLCANCHRLEHCTTRF